MLEKKRNLKGRKNCRRPNMERKIRWKLKDIARGKEGRGSSVWIGYGKIRINEKWWRWDKKKEMLRNKMGNRRCEEQGEGKGEKKGGIR